MSLDQAGMILCALKNVLQQHQTAHDRPWPTGSEWQTLHDAIAATGFEVDDGRSLAGVKEWQSTLNAALRIPAS
ncbi:hypothetical protein [Mycobacteroides abscessus]|uniref:hypothetical protein n=1 Tax=Mycobacteroides abscessus TaxID=36809 RepID=UPI0009A86FD4|nr:hypothetical protein [Mycobacteroides abscessus]